MLGILLVFLHIKTQENAGLPILTKLKYIDAPGTVLFIGAICCLLLALQWGGQSLPWKSSKIICLIVGFGLLLGAFILLQWKKGEYGILPLRIMRQRTMAMVTLLLFFILMAVTIVSTSSNILNVKAYEFLSCNIIFRYIFNR